MRLSDLTPDSVASDVVSAIQTYVAKLALRVTLASPGEPWPCESIRATTADLASYAISGTELDAPAIDYVQSLAEALYVRPADRGSYDTGDLLDDADPSTSWGLVARAALVRQSIEDGEDVSPSALAIVASLSVQAVRQLIASGEIRTRAHRDDSRPGRPASVITATEARRWLSGRGVHGF